jgi:hypothetical protein
MSSFRQRVSILRSIASLYLRNFDWFYLVPDTFFPAQLEAQTGDDVCTHVIQSQNASATAASGNIDSETPAGKLAAPG